MTTEELLIFAEQKGHEVIYADLPETKSLSFESSDCYIGLDKSLYGIEEKERLAHELGHCEYAGFYEIRSDYFSRQKIESRARKWAFLKVLPIADIKKALRAGYCETWELAELFDVSPRFLCEALEYYRSAGALFDIVFDELIA